jgi:hypothetical protein
MKLGIHSLFRSSNLSEISLPLKLMCDRKKRKGGTDERALWWNPAETFRKARANLLLWGSFVLLALFLAVWWGCVR